MEISLSDHKFMKTEVNLLLVVLAVYKFWLEPRYTLLAGLTLPVLLCVLIEVMIFFPAEQRFRFGKTSLTTWLIVGFVMSVESPWWMFFVIALITLGFKHFVRIREKNIFNPAALGMFLALLLFKGETDWKDAQAWYALVPAGLWFAYQAGKLELLAGYFAAALPLAFLEHRLGWNALGHLNYFFIFIMLIEPKTSPAGRWQKILFGAGVASLAFILEKWKFPFEPALFALLVFNALTPWLDNVPDLKLALPAPLRVANISELKSDTPSSKRSHRPKKKPEPVSNRA